MLPFRKYIILLYFLDFDTVQIINKIKELDFYIEESEVLGVIDEYKLVLPDTIKNLLNSRTKLDPENEHILPWLKYFKIEQIYSYLYNNGKNEMYTPLYYKWCRDALWLSDYEDVKNILNIFLFNKEPLESIEKIIRFKFKKKVSQKSIQMYKNLFWDCDSINAKDAILRYLPFRNTTLVLKRLEGDYSTTKHMSIESVKNQTGLVRNILEQDAEWVKWKIGMKDVKVPTPENFLKRVQADTAMLYEEVMQTDKVKEVKVCENKERMVSDEEGGMTSELFDETETITKNTMDFKINKMKQLTDLYVKAQDHMPKDGSDSTKKFFEDLQKVELKYTDEYDAKIVSIEDNKEALDDFLKATGGGEDV